MSDNKIILDTNIVSYLMRGGQMAEVYESFLQGQMLLAITFITVGELYFGAEKANWGEGRRKKLETTLRNFVVIPYDNEIARCYGRLLAEREKGGRPVSSNDAWIAACAVRHEMTLVTHNSKDFEAIKGLKILTASQPQ